MPRPFYNRQVLPVAAQAPTVGGNAMVFQLPRESLIDQINIEVDVLNNGAIATLHPDGLSQFIKSVTLSGSLAGGRYEPIVSIKGSDLFFMAQMHRGTLPFVTSGTPGAATRWRVTIPLYFREFFFSTLIKNLMSAIPAWKMSELTLTITPGSQADVDINAAPTFTITSALVTPIVYQYHRDTIPNDMQFIRGTYETQTDDNPPTTASREVRLPAGGDYTFLGMRARSGAAAAQIAQTDVGTTGPFTYPSGNLRLFELSRNIKYEGDFHKLRTWNLEHILDGLVTGNAFIPFNRFGESEIFQTGAIGSALNNVTVNYNATNVASGFVQFMYRRLFDPDNLLGIQR
jgi:hypothetical protein